MKRKSDPPDQCPVCGEAVHRNARACPECGADERSGWKPDALTEDGLDLPAQEFNYEDFVKEEFGGSGSRSGKNILVAVIAAIILIVFLILYFL